MNRIAKAARIFVAMLREIFDESAYSRFLQRAKMRSCQESYAAFCRERESMTNRRPRCC